MSRCRAFARLAAVAPIVAGALALACLVWAIAQAFVRPPDYPEACLLFNASRIRSGLPLYVDVAYNVHGSKAGGVFISSVFGYPSFVNAHVKP